MKTRSTNLLVLLGVALTFSAACGGSSNNAAPVYFVEIPANPELVVLEQRVEGLRTQLAATQPADPGRTGLIVELAEDLELLIFGRSQPATGSEGPVHTDVLPDYSEVIDLYLQLVAENPMAEQAPNALLQAGLLLAEAGREDSGHVFQRIIYEYPTSPEVFEACLHLGEQAFHQQAFSTATEHMSCARDSYDRPVANYANYVMGWIHYNLNEYQAALDAFELVRSGSPARDMLETTERDMLLAMAQLDDGVTIATETFGDRPAHLSMLLSLYTDTGQVAEFDQLLEFLLETYPGSPELEGWCAQVRAVNGFIDRDEVPEACQAQ